MSTLNRRLLVLNLALLLLVGGFSFTTFNRAEEQDQRVDEQMAISLHDNYNKTASPLNSVLEAIYLDRTAIADINMVLSTNSKSDGVRVYFGKDKNNKTSNVLVNTIGTLVKDDTGFILSSAGKVQICPDYCDLSSPIMNN